MKDRMLMDTIDCFIVRSKPAKTIKLTQKKEESERLRGERDQVKFIDLRYERWQVARFRQARRKQEIKLNKN